MHDSSFTVNESDLSALNLRIVHAGVVAHPQVSGW